MFGAVWGGFRFIFIDHEALALQGDNALGSVRPSVCLGVHLSVLSQFDLRP